MNDEIQLIDKSFVNWVISVLKTNGIDHNQMIKNLKEKNPELAEYAEASAPKINSCMTEYYQKTLQTDLVNYCLMQDNPKKAAEEFFKAIKTTPGTSSIQVSVFKQLKNRRQ